MDTIPLQMMLFGLVDRMIEPFCYGCAGFILSYRIARSAFSKLIFIGITIMCFLWMDDIWPAIGSRTAKMAMASENRTVAKMLEGRQPLGRAEFNSGGQSDLWDVFKLDAWDIGSAIVFVPLAFFIGGMLTNQKQNELLSRK